MSVVILFSLLQCVWMYYHRYRWLYMSLLGGTESIYIILYMYNNHYEIHVIYGGSESIYYGLVIIY